MINFFTILLIAISLSMDTFSLSIAYGTIGIKHWSIMLLSSIVGLFHFIMPLIGNMIGYRIIDKMPIRTTIIVGIVFILIAIQMIFSHEEVSELKNLLSYFMFGLSVSLDSFSIGITISEITNSFVFSYFVISITSFLFTYFGLKFGNIISTKFKNKSVYIGALILLILGILYIF